MKHISIHLSGIGRIEEELWSDSRYAAELKETRLQKPLFVKIGDTVFTRQTAYLITAFGDRGAYVEFEGINLKTGNKGIFSYHAGVEWVTVSNETYHRY